MNIFKGVGDVNGRKRADAVSYDDAYKWAATLHFPS